LAHSVSFGYDKVGNQTTTTDALKNVTTYEYNANNWRVSTTDPLGGVATTAYDSQGRVTMLTDANHVSTSVAYDSDGELISTLDGAGNITRMQYGDSSNGLNGLLAGVVYPTYMEQYKYDARGRQTQTIILPGTNGQIVGQQTTAIGYDAKGRVISITDELGHTTLTQYDALDRQTQINDTLGGVTKYTYDNRNNDLSVTDANSHMHLFSYDLANRRVREGRPLGEFISYTYDASGNLTTRTNPKGERRIYTIDEAGRITKEDQYPPDSNTTSQTVVYSYDATDTLTGYTQTGDTQSSASYTYDAKGQKETETTTYGSGETAFSNTIKYDYYPNGLKKFFTYPDETVISYGYTANNLLASATTPDGKTIQFTGFVWNTPTQVQLPGVVRDVTLDPLQRPTEIRAQSIGNGDISAPKGAVFMDYQYAYDAAGNVTKRVAEDGEYDYAYDNLDRLIGVTPPASLQVSSTNLNGLPVEQYTYDAVNNRISSAHQPGPWAYNADNQLVAYGIAAQQQSYQYNSNGNASQQTTGDPSAPSATRTYLYNTAERLTEIDDNGTVTATYRYDPMGRRIQKQVGVQVTWYQYADEGLVAEYAQGGARKRIYGWKPSEMWSTNPLWLADISADKWLIYTYQNDHLGTPQRITDSNGILVWKGTSEAFGKITVDPTSLTNNSLRFPGQYADEESGLNYNYSREYDPLLGRYIESDRIGLSGGNNIYVYANSQSITQGDPNAEFAFLIPIIVNGIIAAGTEIITTGLTQGWDCVNLGDAAWAGLEGAAFSGAITGVARVLLSKGPFIIKGVTLFKRGTPRGNGYVNHKIFQSGPNPNYRIEWATEIEPGNGNFGLPHWHGPTNPKIHRSLPPSGMLVGFANAETADPCKCKK